MEGLCSKVYIRDIRDWEDTYNKNILRLFDKISSSNIIDIISIINKCDTETSSKLLDMLLEEHTILDIYNELRNILLGYKYLDTSEDSEDDSDDKNEDTFNNYYDDMKNYTYLSDYYMHVCMQMMSIGLTYNEFWSLCTKEIYQVFNAINQKQILDYNKQIQINYTTAALIGGAVWGKLPDRVPTLDPNSFIDEDKVISTEYGDMTLRDYKSIIALMKLGGD